MAIIRAPKKSKWYVVWYGHAPGIYPSWDKCRPQVEGFPGSKFRAYDTLAEARIAFEKGPARGGPPKTAETDETPSPLPKKVATKAVKTQPAAAEVSKPAKASKVSKPKHGAIIPSICVDAACNMETRVMEYRGVDTATGKELFRMGPFNGATNNMGEFLAVVHAMGVLAKKGKSLPIYSDSKTALAWVRDLHAKTTVKPTKENREVFELMARAEEWLRSNKKQFSVLKWETEKWGENPADFGRK